MRAAAFALLLALAAPSAQAQAQAPADPIGELLAPPAPAPTGSEAQRNPGRPLTEAELAYEARVRASVAAAQGFQGPLDGGWILAGPDGDLFALQLADRGADEVEGAWRDLRRPGALSASGLVESIERQGGALVLRFGSGAAGWSAYLQASADGRWRGELVEAGARSPAVLRRSGGP